LQRFGDRGFDRRGEAMKQTIQATLTFTCPESYGDPLNWDWENILRQGIPSRDIRLFSVDVKEAEPGGE
jgi:hypothetical protein